MDKKRLYAHFFIPLVIVMVSTVSVSAQLLPVYSQFPNNLMFINPAAAGLDSNIQLSSIYRRQWVSIPGAPVTAAFAMSYPGKNKFGFGLQMYADKLGIESNNSIEAMMSYHVQLSATTRMSMGFQFGYRSYRANRRAVDVIDPNDPGFQSDINFSMPAAGFGLHVFGETSFLGISVPSFLLRTQDQKKFGNSVYASTIGQMPFFISAGKNFTIQPQLSLSSTVLFRLIGRQPFQFEINHLLWLNPKFGAGLGYRSSEALIGLVQFNASSQFRIGYAYDYSVNKLGAFNQGGHELLITMRLSKYKRLNKSEETLEKMGKTDPETVRLKYFPKFKK